MPSGTRGSQKRNSGVAAPLYTCFFLVLRLNALWHSRESTKNSWANNRIKTAGLPLRHIPRFVCSAAECPLALAGVKKKGGAAAPPCIFFGSAAECHLALAGIKKNPDINQTISNLNSNSICRKYRLFFCSAAECPLALAGVKKKTSGLAAPLCFFVRSAAE